MPGGISNEVLLATLQMMANNDGYAESRDVKQLMEEEGKTYAPSRIMGVLMDEDLCEKSGDGWTLTQQGYRHRDKLEEEAETDRTSARRKTRLRNDRSPMELSPASTGPGVILPEIRDRIIKLSQGNETQEELLHRLMEANQAQKKQISEIESALRDALSPLLDLARHLGMIQNFGVKTESTPENNQGASAKAEMEETAT